MPPFLPSIDCHSESSYIGAGDRRQLTVRGAEMGGPSSNERKDGVFRRLQFVSNKLRRGHAANIAPRPALGGDKVSSGISVLDVGRVVRQFVSLQCEKEGCRLETKNGEKTQAEARLTSDVKRSLNILGSKNVENTAS